MWRPCFGLGWLWQIVPMKIIPLCLIRTMTVLWLLNSGVCERDKNLYCDRQINIAVCFMFKSVYFCRSKFLAYNRSLTKHLQFSSGDFHSTARSSLSVSIRLTVSDCPIVTVNRSGAKTKPDVWAPPFWHPVVWAPDVWALAYERAETLA